MRFSLLSIILLASPFLSTSFAAPTGTRADSMPVIGDLCGRELDFASTRTLPPQKRAVGSHRPSTSPAPSASASARYHPRAFVPLPTTVPLGTVGDLARCPVGDIACPITPRLGAGPVWDEDYECITPAEDLYSCGGCSTLGTGQDCTAIPNILSVSCASSSCIVHSCQPGYTPSGGNTCVPALTIFS